MLIYISSYPRSGNSLMQNLIGNFFARPITGIGASSKLIKNKNTKNWRYNNRALPDSHEEIQLLTSKLNKQIYSIWNRFIFRRYDISEWLVLYDLDVPPYTKNCRSLLPGCKNILTPKNRQKLAADPNYFFIKTHSLPYSKYFDNEYVIQIVRHPSLVFESYFHFVNRNSNKDTTLNEVIMGKVPYGSWSEWHQQWEQIIPALQNQFLRLRFEDILANPTQACEQIKELIGLNYNSEQKLTSFEELHQRNPNYYRSGKTEKKSTPITPDQKALLQQLHGVTIAQLGYE